MSVISVIVNAWSGHIVNTDDTIGIKLPKPEREKEVTLPRPEPPTPGLHVCDPRNGGWELRKDL